MILLGPLLAGLAVFLVVADRTGHLQVLSLAGRRQHRQGARTWLVQAGSDTTPLQFIAVSAAMAGAALLLCLAVSGTLLVGVVPAAAALAAPRTWYAHQRRVRLAAVGAAWPDGILHLLGALRSGGSVHVALVELSRAGPDALRTAFGNYEPWALVGSPATALVAVRETLADPVSDKAIGVLIEASRRGTDVALTILEGFVDEVRDDGRVTAQIKASQRQPLVTGIAAFAFPWLGVLAGCAMSTDFRDYYRSSAATTVVLVAAVTSAVMFAIIRWLAKEPAERRVVGGTS